MNFGFPPLTVLNRRRTAPAAGWLLLLALTVRGGADSAPNGPETDEPVVETVIPYRGQTIVIRSRTQAAEGSVYTAAGGVEIRYEGMVFRAERISYDSESGRLTGEGQVEFQAGVQEFRCARFEFDVPSRTGRFWATSGVTDRHFRLAADEVHKTGPEVYEFRAGTLTTCEHEDHPHWSLSAGHTRVVRDRSATVRGGVFRLFRVPVLYLPWLHLPIQEQGRGSGLLIPSTGNSNQKGRKVSQGFYLTLGRSADLTVRGDYFSRRGWGVDTQFRSRLSEESYLNFASYSVKDRQGQGGSAINIDSFFRFGRGFRAAIGAGIITDIVFRQVYTDSFDRAVRPDEYLQVDIARNGRDTAFLFSTDHRQYYLPDREQINRLLPAASFHLVGRPLADWPALLSVSASAAGLHKRAAWWEVDPRTGARVERTFDTPNTTLRLDVRSRLLLPLHLGSLLRLTVEPSVSGTGYTHSLDSPDPDGGVPGVSGDSLFRGLAAIAVEVGLPRLYRFYGEGLKHVVEGAATWRLAGGGQDLDRVILFEPLDAAVPTHEVDYRLVNRLIGRRNGLPWEWASLEVRQKYYFDPDFGGALRPGRENQFLPLLAWGPYGATGIARRFSPLQVATRFNPSAGVSVAGRVEYDTVLGGFRDWGVAGTATLEWVSLAAAYHRLRPLEPHLANGHYIQPSVTFGRAERGLSLNVNGAWNIHERNLDNIFVRVNYFTDCLGLSVEYSTFDITHRRRENEFRVTLSLRGVGAFGRLRGPGQRVF